jgi:hypothetical protein
MTSMLDNPWDLFPSHRHLGTEESGNEIIVDTSLGDAGPVYGLWHDPPAIVVLARSEQEFRAMAPDMGAGDETITLPEAVHDRVSAALAWSMANAMTIEAARGRLGTALADWLSSLPPDATVWDLRSGDPGTGFEWGLESTITRHPETAVYAVRTQPPKPSFFKRLFG